MTSSFQLGFTPFASPLRAKTFRLDSAGGIEDSWHYKVSLCRHFWVVGFRQKKGTMQLVTPRGKDLPWAENDQLETFLELYVQDKGSLNPSGFVFASESEAILWDSETAVQWDQISEDRLFSYYPQW